LQLAHAAPTALGLAVLRAWHGVRAELPRMVGRNNPTLVCFEALQ